ncbi:MAG: LysR family transcriptional regulator [Roseiflexaceae bacterium]
MELRHLITFRTIVATGSFTRSADLLGYAQSSITAHVQVLEQELGVPLFDRIGRQVTLTTAGQRFYSYATKLIALSEEAKAVLSDPQIPSGTLTIGAPESLCTYRLPQILRMLRQQWPELRVIFRPGGTNLYERVQHGELDLALVMDTPHQYPAIISEALTRERIVLIAHPEHPLRQATAITPQQIQHETLLLTEAGCAYRVRFEAAWQAAGVAMPEQLEFSSIEAIKQCVIAGMGIAILPAISVERELSQVQLVALDWGGTDLSVITQIITHAERWRSPALLALIEGARQVVR